MNIVALDCFTVNPGDLSWDEISQLGNLTIYNRSTPEEVVERAKDAEMILINKSNKLTNKNNPIINTIIFNLLYTNKSSKK